MNVVDSCGWLEHLAGTSLGEQYGRAIQDTDSLVVPVVCLCEVLRTVMRRAGPDRALEVVAAMGCGTVVDVDSPLAVAAARLGVEHRLPLADSLIYATARLRGAEVWTHDAHFRGLPGVRFIEAPGC